MGFDVSYHPVDLGIMKRVAAYVAGRDDLRSLVEEGCVRERCRFRAKAWGLGLLEATRHASRSPTGDDKAGAARVDASLHVWGRPFLIEADTPEQVSAAVDGYLAARTDAEVDAIASAHLAKLAPGIPVKPDMEDGLPSGAELEDIVLRDLNVLPSVFAAAREGKELVALPSGDEVDPAGVLASSYPFLGLAFMARFRPGWMDRGHVWPTLLLEDAGLSAKDFFEPPIALFHGILGELPKATATTIVSRLSPGIVENYMTGGFVPAEKVGDLRAFLRANREKLLAKPKAEDWADECAVSLQKLDEALADAAARKLAFAEATEIYSGPMGIVN